MLCAEQDLLPIGIGSGETGDTSVFKQKFYFGIKAAAILGIAYMMSGCEAPYDVSMSDRQASVAAQTASAGNPGASSSSSSVNNGGGGVTVTNGVVISGCNINLGVVPNAAFNFFLASYDLASGLAPATFRVDGSVFGTSSTYKKVAGSNPAQYNPTPICASSSQTNLDFFISPTVNPGTFSSGAHNLAITISDCAGNSVVCNAQFTVP